MRLSHLRFAARVGARLCFLPMALRVRTLPLLLERLSRSAVRARNRDPLELDRAVQIVGRVCRMRLFDLPVFPRACLRRALALYYMLGRMGYPVEIHIGVRKDGRDLHAHSWVTLDGKSLGEKSPMETFCTIYSYPTVSYGSASREIIQPQTA